MGTSCIRRLSATLQSQGLIGTVATIAKRPVRSTAAFREQVLDGKGLEIGGPSPFFRTFLPIYEYIASLDNCVFASDTVWEGRVTETFVYHPTKPPGRNYIIDGVDLGRFSDGSYDFVLSCHNLEHIANPVKALKEWIRVTKPGGCIILVLPDCHRTFDHRRSPTPVSHMLDDYARNVTEDDATHLEEILAKHDLRRDPSAGTWENFRQRSVNNSSFRCLHHHVFDTNNLRELMETLGLNVKVVETARPFHITLLARLPDRAQRPEQDTSAKTPVLVTAQ
jgi:SAM-dependent methyltransferase